MPIAKAYTTSSKDLNSAKARDLRQVSIAKSGHIRTSCLILAKPGENRSLGSFETASCSWVARARIRKGPVGTIEQVIKWEGTWTASQALLDQAQLCEAETRSSVDNPSH